MKFSLKSIVPPLDFGWNYVRARCARRTCHAKLLMRAVPQSRTGIHVGPLWYCSPDCFSVSMRTPLAELMAGRIAEMPREPRLSLGLVMLSRGFLTEEQLRAVTSRSALGGEALDKTLLELGLVDERQLAAARAAQWGYPILAQEDSGLTLRVELPLTWMRGFDAVPLHYAPVAKRLLLGFVHRVERSLLLSIERVTGCVTEPCFLTPSAFERQMQRITKTADYEEIAVEETATPEEMARMLGWLAVQVGARQAEYAPCRNWIWVRLTGKRKTTDVMFLRKVATRSARMHFMAAQTSAWTTG